MSYGLCRTYILKLALCFGTRSSKRLVTCSGMGGSGFRIHWLSRAGILKPSSFCHLHWFFACNLGWFWITRKNTKYTGRIQQNGLLNPFMKLWPEQTLFHSEVKLGPSTVRLMISVEAITLIKEGYMQQSFRYMVLLALTLGLAVLTISCKASEMVTTTLTEPMSSLSSCTSSTSWKWTFGGPKIHWEGQDYFIDPEYKVKIYTLPEGYVSVGKLHDLDTLDLK